MSKDEIEKIKFKNKNIEEKTRVNLGSPKYPLPSICDQNKKNNLKKKLKKEPKLNQ
jgi:hypothetical protein